MHWFALVVLAVGSLWADRATACGAWTLESPDGRLSVRFGWQSVSVTRDKRVELARLEQKDGVARKLSDVSIESGVIRRGDVVLGKIDAGKLVVGDRSYVIEIADVPAANDTVLRWIVTVKTRENGKDVVILSGRAMSLLSSCMNGESLPKYPPAVEAEDIHNRVALALLRSL